MPENALGIVSSEYFLLIIFPSDRRLVLSKPDNSTGNSAPGIASLQAPVVSSLECQHFTFLSLRAD